METCQPTVQKQQNQHSPSPLGVITCHNMAKTALGPWTLNNWTHASVLEVLVVGCHVISATTVPLT